MFTHTIQASREPEGPVDEAKAAAEAKVSTWANSYSTLCLIVPTQ